MLKKIATAAVLAGLALTGTAQAAGVNPVITKYFSENPDCTESFKMPCRVSIEGSVLRVTIKVPRKDEGEFNPLASIVARSMVPQFCQMAEDSHFFELGLTKIVFSFQKAANGDALFVVPVTRSACN